MTRILLLLLALVLVSCGPRCLKGHYVPRWVEPHTTQDVFMSIPVGDSGMTIPIYKTTYHPGYWTQDFVCDQYEVEKFDK